MRHGLVSKRLDYKTGKLLSALILVLYRSTDQSPRAGVIQQDKYSKLKVFPKTLWEESISFPMSFGKLKTTLRKTVISYINTPVLL